MAFIIEDTRLMAYTYNDGDQLSYDDCIELFIQTNNDSISYWNSNVYHIFVGLNNNITQKRGIDPVPGKGKIQQVIIDDLVIRSYVRQHGTLNDNRDVDSCYVAELAISWESLGIKPKAGTTFRFNYAIDDLDRDIKTEALNESSDTYYHLAQMWSDRYKNYPSEWIKITLEGTTTARSIAKKSEPPIYKGLVVVITSILLGFLVIAAGVVYWTKKRSKEISTKLRNEIDFKLRSFIDENFKKKTSLEDFCKQYNLSIRQVQRWIKSDMDTTFNDMLTRRRMKEAKEMLEMTTKSISEICFDIGYNDTSYMTKIFKSIYGIPPTEFRKTGNKTV